MPYHRIHPKKRKDRLRENYELGITNYELRRYN
jgi:hypothetical protein